VRLPTENRRQLLSNTQIASTLPSIFKERTAKIREKPRSLRKEQNEYGMEKCRRPREPFVNRQKTAALLGISRKEVIQPQVPLRLPCYDFAPVTDFTFDGCLLAVSPPASGAPSFHGVTGGVYKARERIHRGMADPRLLAIPTSCSRVTDCNPNLDRL
jgi:hypothetical protein